LWLPPYSTLVIAEESRPPIACGTINMLVQLRQDTARHAFNMVGSRPAQARRPGPHLRTIPGLEQRSSPGWEDCIATLPHAALLDEQFGSSRARCACRQITGCEG